MTAPYRCILFDLDHTLFDFEASKEVAFSNVVASLGISEASAVSRLAAQFHDVERPLWKGLESGELTLASLNHRRWQGLLDVADLEAEADAATLGAAYLFELGRNGGFFPGARDVLETLHGDFLLGMITNGYAEVQRARMEHFDFGHLFGPVVISSEIGVAKPDRRFFDVARAQVSDDITNDEILVVGDSLSSDMAGAVGYGLDAVWFNPSKLPVPSDLAITWSVQDLYEVIPIATGIANGGAPK